MKPGAPQSIHSAGSLRSVPSGRAAWLVATVIIGLGIALHWPMMHLGFALDDYAQTAMAEGRYPSPRHPLDLFTFSKGTAQDNGPLMESGYYPWWAHPEVRLSMWRPLSSALIELDLALFGHDAFAHHLHSLIWWVLMLAAAFWLYRAVLPPLAALAALAFLVVDQPHTIGLGWLANRNAILAGLLSTVALLGYLRFRERGERTGAVLCTVSFALSLLTGEYGLSALGYFMAYELLARGDAPLRKLRALSLVLVPSFFFLIGRYVAGTGARYSDLYVDPVRSPLQFARALLQRYPALVNDAALSIHSDYWSVGPPWVGKLVELEWLRPEQVFDIEAIRRRVELLAVPGLLLFFGALLFVARRSRPRATGAAVWLGLGAAIAMLPLVGSMPTSRLLVLPAIGVAALLGALLVTLVAQLKTGQRRVLALVGAVLLLVVHGVAPAVQARDEGGNVHFFTERLRAAALRLPLPQKGLADARVVILAAADPTQMIYTRMIRNEYGKTAPKSVRVLSGAMLPYMLTRDDARTLSLRFGPHMALFVNPVERMFRTQDAPMKPGDRVTLEGMSVTVLEVLDGRPRAIRFVFDRPLEAEGLYFLQATEHGFERFTPPPVGTSVLMPPPAMPVAIEPQVHTH